MGSWEEENKVSRIVCIKVQGKHRNYEKEIICACYGVLNRTVAIFAFAIPQQFIRKIIDREKRKVEKRVASYTNTIRESAAKGNEQKKKAK